jgi:3-deoxy-manno-octulosonate cytidylyltransferase (CMP-KDO synthetase)
MKTVGIIPARWSSTRLPGKPLIKIRDKPMIWWVYQNASKSKVLNEVIVATDDKRIFNTVVQFWGAAVMTSPKHLSGTDRVGEAVENKPADIVVNIQGDEPFLDSKNIDKAVNTLLKDKNADVSTLACKISNRGELKDPNVVKVTFDKNKYATDFSRNNPSNYKHIGLYAYRKNYLMKFIKMKQSNREKTEKLEQLRILENGGKIKVAITRKGSISVDTKADLKKINEAS